MKIKVTNAQFDNNYTGNFTIELYDEDGNKVLTTTRGFTSTSNNAEKVKEEIMKSLSNIKEQYLNETNSVAKQEMLKTVGKEFDVRLDINNKEIIEKRNVSKEL